MDESKRVSDERLAKMIEEASTYGEATAEWVSAARELQQRRAADDIPTQSIIDGARQLRELYGKRAATEREEELERIIRNFLQRYGECEEHINAAFAFQHNHGIPYRGPNYESELNGLRRALAQPKVK